MREPAWPATLIALARVRPQPERLRHQLGRDLRLRMGFRFLIEGVLHHRREDARRGRKAARDAARLLAHPGDLPRTADELIKKANEAGGDDNITVIVAGMS